MEKRRGRWVVGPRSGQVYPGLTHPPIILSARKWLAGYCTVQNKKRRPLGGVRQAERRTLCKRGSLLAIGGLIGGAEGGGDASTMRCDAMRCAWMGFGFGWWEFHGGTDGDRDGDGIVGLHGRAAEGREGRGGGSTV